jgi:multicomponent Na+:H+ antiporter subunit D
MPVVARAFFVPVRAGAGGGDGHGEGIQEAPLFCLVPICLTALGCLVLFFFADEVHDLLKPLVTP